ncbi:hypothetical protein [Streptomyces sp. NPDC008092]|uniref:hypothetical protein n=1 Tax=Streptomyces sp. NPDC008092 TaxID=3364808 RepID=UPI0036F0F5BF
MGDVVVPYGQQQFTLITWSLLRSAGARRWKQHSGFDRMPLGRSVVVPDLAEGLIAEMNPESEGVRFA